MKDAAGSSPLIQSKLHRPPLGRGHIHRQHLVDHLDKDHRRTLTLVSAPAGYGKTTLVSCWLEANGNPTAWLTLDEGDSDLHLFLGYFLTAVQKLFPDVGCKTLAMAQALAPPPVSVLARNLINELDVIEQPYILVLDDFHLIKDESVNDLLTQLLHHPPQCMHLVLICRRDPRLPISTLRAKGFMREIRTQELRFSERETALLLMQELGSPVDPATASILGKKTEGWVTGLRLAALSIRQRRGAFDQKSLELQADAQYVMEYLFTEIFSHLPKEISHYLVGISILDQFCGPLCEAVCIPGTDQLTCGINGWDFIAWLKRENMFIIPLDSENRWFRFHHVFRKLLSKQLYRRHSTKEINTLHRQAGDWLAGNDMIEEALRHVLASGEVETAAGLIAQHGQRLIDSEQWKKLQRWLRLIPGDQIEQNPELLVLEAWHFHVQQNWMDMFGCVEKIDALIATSSKSNLKVARHVEGHLEAMRGFQHYMDARGKSALICSQRACEKIPRHHRRARVRERIRAVGECYMR